MKSFDIALKDLLSSFRNRFALMMMFVIPMVITGLIFFAFGGMSSGNRKEPALRTINVAVVNLDKGSAYSGNMGQIPLGVLGSAGLNKIIRVSELGSEEAAREAVNHQQAAVAVVVPEDFSAAVTSPATSAAVRLIQDPTLTIGPQIVLGILQRFLDALSGARISVELARREHSDLSPVDQFAMGKRYGEWAQAQGDRPVLSVRPPAEAAVKVNPMAQVIGRIMAGMLVFFVFYSAAYTAMTILREDEQGTLARLFTTPTGRSAILGGKFLSVFLTVLVQTVVLMIASGFAFHINWGQPASVAMSVLGSSLCAGGFGIMLISFIRDTRQSGPVLGGALSVAGMLGGLFTAAVPNIPAAINRVALVVPQGWVMRAYSLAVGGGAPVRLLLPFSVSLAIGIVCFVIGTAVFRRRFA